MSQTWTGAGERLGGRLREADFHRGERAGVVGADGVSGRLAGVAVEAAGDVDGELLRRLRVHPIDGRVERRAGSPTAPVPSRASTSQAAPACDR